MPTINAQFDIAGQFADLMTDHHAEDLHTMTGQDLHDLLMFRVMPFLTLAMETGANEALNHLVSDAGN